MQYVLTGNCYQVLQICRLGKIVRVSQNLIHKQAYTKPCNRATRVKSPRNGALYCIESLTSPDIRSILSMQAELLCIRPCECGTKCVLSECCHYQIQIASGGIAFKSGPNKQQNISADYSCSFCVCIIIHSTASFRI